jgi:hypothetical protein
VIRSWSYGDPPPFGVTVVRDTEGIYWWYEHPPGDVRSDYCWTDGEQRRSWLMLVRDGGPVVEVDEAELAALQARFP